MNIFGDYFKRFNNTDIAARLSQIRDYYGQTGKEPLTEPMLKYAREHYEKDTGIKNRVQEMLWNTGDLKGLAEWGNKHLVTEFSMTADVTEEWSSEGSSSILFEYEAMPEGEGISAHFYCTDLIETDWSDFTKLTATVNNTSSKAILLQFYTKSGDNWAWSDTEALTIEPGIKDIVFDFSETKFMDSSGIGIIMGRYKKIALFGGKVFVVHADRQIKRILLVSGMSKLVEIME
jgi:anti-anti-sigma factor